MIAVLKSLHSIFHQVGYHTNSHKGWTSFSLLLVMQPVLILCFAILLIFKNLNYGKEVKELCYKESLVLQAQQANFFNFLERVYNKKAGLLNIKAHRWEKKLAATPPQGKALILPILLKIYKQQKQIHNRLLTSWRKIIRERKSLLLEVKVKLSEKLKAKTTMLVAKKSSLIKTSITGYSPLYRIVNRSQVKFHLKLQSFGEESLLPIAGEILPLAKKVYCKSEIKRSRGRWFAEIQEDL